jgi:hypothetical protein
MFAQVSRPALIAATDWSSGDLDNHVHWGLLPLAWGCFLPVRRGTYIGPDCFSVRLFDALKKEGFDRVLSARFVRDYEKWLPGLERVEWPDMFPPPAPSPWTPTASGLAAGSPPEVHWDAEIYFSVARTRDGGFQTVCGPFSEIIPALLHGTSEDPDRFPTQITNIPLRKVYLDTLAGATAAGVDLGEKFTRPKGHPEHIRCIEAIAAHRALSFRRVETRTAPGPKPGRKTRKRRQLA